MKNVAKTGKFSRVRSREEQLVGDIRKSRFPLDFLNKIICLLSANLLFTNASDTFRTFGSLIGLKFRMGQSERRTS